jgi:hypothetical protein
MSSRKLSPKSGSRLCSNLESQIDRLSKITKRLESFSPRRKKTHRSKSPIKSPIKSPKYSSGRIEILKKSPTSGIAVLKLVNPKIEIPTQNSDPLFNLKSNVNANAERTAIIDRAAAAMAQYEDAINILASVLPYGSREKQEYVRKNNEFVRDTLLKDANNWLLTSS